MAELNARIIAKASGTAGEEPQAADLEVAELAVNTADGKLFTKHTDSSIVTISGGGGGGSSTLEGLTDTDFDTSPSSSVNFTSFDSGQPAFTDPYSSATGGSIDSTLGTNAWKVLASDYYGDGSKLDSFLGTDGRYDVVNFRVRSAQAFNTNNRVSLGGNRADIGTTSAGFTLYTRATGFSFYGNGSFQELGTLPTMNADTWYEITWVADWGSAQRAVKPSISLWVDGAIAVNNATPSSVTYVEMTGAEANNFRFAWNSTPQSNSADKFWDDIRVYTSDTLPWGMTDATITDPAGQMDSTYITPGVYGGSLLAWNATSTKWEVTTSSPADGQVLTWVDANSQWEPAAPSGAVDSVNGETGAVSLGLNDLDDVSRPGFLASYTSTPASGGQLSPGGWEAPAAGNPDLIQINATDSEGVNHWQAFTDWVSTSPTSVWIKVADGSNTWTESTGITISDSLGASSSSSSRIGIDGLSDVSASTTGPVYFAPTNPEGLPSDEDILQWDDSKGNWVSTPLVVESSIQGATDFGLQRTALADPVTRTYNASKWFDAPAGDVGGALISSSRLFFAINPDGNPVSNVLGYFAAQTAPFTVWMNGKAFTVTYANTTADNAGNGGCLDITVSGLTNIADVPNYASGITLEALGAGIPVADGQILTWADSGSQWQPADLQGGAVRAALGIGEYVDDTAAGTGGVASGAMYYNTTSSDYRLKT